jgi:predicted nucleotidyltransferase
VIVFGSVARGESWPRGMPIRSDLDLLVITDSPLPGELVDELVRATMPLFLECGRQLGPQFRTRPGLAEPKDERAAAFLANVEREGITIYRRRS